MKRVFLFCIYLILTGCSEKKPERKYPVIDVGSSAGDYRRAYCSDFLSSIELIPLEMNHNSLIAQNPTISVHDSLIFVWSIISYSNLPMISDLHVFNLSGKFKNKIGGIGQGPGEYPGILSFFINHNKSTVYIYDGRNIHEYTFNGKFIGSFRLPRPNDKPLDNISHLENDLFVGSLPYRYGNTNNYCLFDRTGNIVKWFPSRYFNDNDMLFLPMWLSAGKTFRIDSDLHVKDFVNDTIYAITSSNLQPAYVFDFGKYAYPLEKINDEGKIKIKPVDRDDANRLYMYIREIFGTQKYLFYSTYIPSILPRPKSRPFFLNDSEIPQDQFVRGIYNIAVNTNILLDTDKYLQNGLVNDMNGGLSFFPKYYAGDNVVVDIWQAHNMKEILTEEYFSTIKIKDQQAHQKLRDLLKTLKEDDNPVVVIA